MTGEQLAQIHCVRCHRVPVPSELAKERWPRILDYMGNFLGFPKDVVIANTIDVRQFWKDTPGMLLPAPVMTGAEFARLRDYFIANSSPEPRTFAPSAPVPVTKQFRVAQPVLDLKSPDDKTWVLLSSVDEKRGRLYVGTVSVADESNPRRQLASFPLQGAGKAYYQALEAEPRGIEYMPWGFRLHTMGMFGPLGGSTGKIIDFEAFESEQPRQRMLVNGSMNTIVQKTADLNGDGRDDLLLADYGMRYWDGGLKVYWQTVEYPRLWDVAPAKIADGPLPGALRESAYGADSGYLGAVVSDFNQDGRPDFAVLRAQGAQQLIVFLNQGEERFEQRLVAEWGPTFGGMALEAADIDGDGRVDLIVSNGNNREHGMGAPPRAVHGIRILRNEGDLTFTERFFFPMYGATKTCIADFDGDGDQDIAAISLDPYMDEARPLSFVYLQNQGGWRFEAATMPWEYWNTWMECHVGDVNGDGKPDIVLGSAQGFTRNAYNDKQFQRLFGKRTRFSPVLYLINDT